MSEPIREPGRIAGKFGPTWGTASGGLPNRIKFTKITVSAAFIARAAEAIPYSRITEFRFDANHVKNRTESTDIIKTARV